MFRDTTVASDDLRIVVERHSCVVAFDVASLVAFDVASLVAFDVASLVAFDAAPLEVVDLVDFCYDSQQRTAIIDCKIFYSEAIELVPATCVQTRACSAEAVPEVLSDMHRLVVVVEEEYEPRILCSIRLTYLGVNVPIVLQVATRCLNLV